MLISQENVDLLIEHAEDCLPFEAVAFLLGRFGKHIEVSRIVIMTNRAKSPTEFSVSPEDEYRVFLQAEAAGDLVIGIFHSHPAPPEPSSVDLENMKLNRVVWMIASKVSGKWELSAYLMSDHIAKRIPLVISSDCAAAGP
ncbi:MAG: M67 family metallopeptidase [Candidatus Thorarchaeota archaeon]